MRRGYGGAKRTGGRRANGKCGAIGAAGRARRDAAGRVQLDVRRQVAGKVDGGARGFAFFQRKLIGRGVDLAEVVDTAIGLGGGAGFQKAGNRYGREQADDGHDDHDFYQGETRWADVFACFHYLRDVGAAERSVRRVIISLMLFRNCLTEPNWLMQSKDETKRAELAVRRQPIGL